MKAKLSKTLLKLQSIGFLGKEEGSNLAVRRYNNEDRGENYRV